jgi:hypothetical protein
MAVPRFFKWLGEEFSGQLILGGLGKMLLGLWGTPAVQNKVDQVFQGFLPNKESDEQLFNAAIATAPMTPALTEKLLARLSALPADQQDRFRIIVAQQEFTGEKKDKLMGSPAETAKVLKALTELTDTGWSYYIINMNLHKPLPVRGFLQRLKEDETGLKAKLASLSERIDDWAEHTAAPAVREATAQIDDLTADGFDWDPKNNRFNFR